MKKILVIDGNSIINRAFYGIRPLTTKSGKQTGAVYGTINMISKQLERIKPDYAAVAFDVKRPTFRHEMYAEYKAGRHQTPPELLEQFDDTKECLRLMGLKVLTLNGYEADDIQGTIARLAHTCEDTESYVFSGDRDLLQLIDDKTTVLLATNQDTIAMHRDEFREKYGIEPECFVDMKALMGDSSDNIPGVRGIGAKTAEGLIKNFSTLEGIYENIDDPRISRGVREKLLTDRDNAYLSRTLARIDTNAPLDLTLDDIAYFGPDRQGLYKKLCELELNSVIAKLGLDKPMESDDAPTEKIEQASFRKITSAEIPKGEGTSVAVFKADDGVYVNIKEENLFFNGDFCELAPLFSGAEIIGYDCKALAREMLACGMDIDKSSFLDLLLYEYVLNPGSGNAGLPSLISMFLGKSVSEGTPCPDIMRELEAVLRKKVAESGQSDVLFSLELPLIPVLARMEHVGFKINPDGISEFGEALAGLAEELAQRIYMQAGEVFNLNSPKQLGEVLYEKMGLGTMVKKSKTGYHTDAETLAELRHLSPIIDDILEYRQVTKLKSTYTSPLVAAADANNRIHTDFKQALTATGRLSSADPNLQNIPIKTKMGRELRRFFIAEEGYTLVDADYSQIELRILAHISDDYTMRESFIAGEDIHTRTAAAVFGCPEEQVTSEMRKRAKAVNFGIVYGISGFSLAKDIGTSVPEATKYIKNYLMNYPSVDRYLEDVVKNAEADGYTATIMGRRRYIPELKAAKAPLRQFGKRVAMNAPIQGTAADIIKLAMIRVYNRLKCENLDARLVMQVHDELIVEARCDVKDRVAQILKEEMESTASLTVPLIADVTTGINWLEQE